MYYLHYHVHCIHVFHLKSDKFVNLKKDAYFPHIAHISLNLEDKLDKWRSKVSEGSCCFC